MHHHVLQVPYWQTRLQLLHLLGILSEERREIDWPFEAVLDALRLLRLEGYPLRAVKLEFASLVVASVVGFVRSLLAEYLLRLSGEQLQQSWLQLRPSQHSDLRQHFLRHVLPFLARL